MTFAASPSSPDTGSTCSVAHDKAVDLLLRDREMVSRLLREHQMLHEVFQHSPMPSVIHDSDGTLLAWNALYDRLNADEIEFDILASARLNPEPYTCDYGQDGAFRGYDYTLPNGCIARVAAPLPQDEAAAITPDNADMRDRSDLLVSVTHEIRVPLNGLLGMAGLLAESGLSKGQQMYADVVLRSAEALMAITDDVLDLSRIDAGGMALNCASFDIADCIEETATLFAANADKRGLDLIVRIDPVLPRRLIGDEGRLRQAIAKVLGNAIKFTETGHVLLDMDATMKTREGGRRVAGLTCRVTDTGVGMSKDRCAAIRAGQETGLGLSITTGLIDTMGGTWDIDSVEGEGSTFRFTVDLPVDASDTMRFADAAVQGKHLLVVDAQAQRRTIIAESVGAWGFEVSSCAGTAEAFALMDDLAAQEKSVDLVLLGEQVTEGDAPHFTGALKHRAKAPPIVLMARLSALTICDADEEDGVVLAATLPRPVESTRLLQSIEQALKAQGRGPVAVGSAGFDESAPGGNRVEQSEPPCAGGPGSLDILIAEDNEVNQFLIAEILRDSGYSYKIVPDGRAAVEAWRSACPRLILMDVSMPVMSGDEATMQIRAEEEGKSRTPIVAVTAHALRGDRERCMRAGMDDHLSKPVTVEAIMKAVDFYLQPQDVVASG